ncbi:MAG: hypothetical protein HQL52_07105 [Magnetococcales bacterium]|nr:hypothetical protein [Magnetococcales bacterium]
MQKKPSEKGWHLPGLSVHFAILLLVLMAGPRVGIGAENASGSCAGYDFSHFYQGEELKWAGVARVLSEGAPFYKSMGASSAQGKLSFNQQAEILAESKDRLKIHAFRYDSQPEVTGWVKKGDLLCRNLPIKGESGLEKKFFIRTSTAPRKDNQIVPTVNVFQGPGLKECVGGKGTCREGASRFHMYFVFDEREDALLLADRYRLEEDDMLLGWVSKKDGFVWNNAFSLRPKEDLKSPDKKSTGTICAYEQLLDAVSDNKDACQPVKGGVEWLKSPLRIPVLGLVDEKNNHVKPGSLSGKSSGDRRFYKVALAQPGLVGRSVGDGKFAISSNLAADIIPEFTPKSATSVESLSAKKRVDIFFLLDATASMDAVIDAVRGVDDKSGVIQEIIDSLKNTQGFKETQLRFGFRVFRDPYADKQVTSGLKDGIGEGLPLSGACELNSVEQKLNFKNFQKAISKVSVTSDDKDDYQENVYGGLKQVLTRDITSCPDHLKLFFVIGDHGYKAIKRTVKRNGRRVHISKYEQSINRESLVQLLRGSGKIAGQENNVIPFFIQTPNRGQKAKHPRAYNRAYRQFAQQAKYLLQKSLPKDSKVEDHFFRMGEEQLLGRVVNTVEKLGSSSLIDEIILDIRGGAALNTVIDRLRRQRVDIPGVYWHILEKGACGELGEQCRNRVFDTTMIGYIEATEEVVEELWIDSSALSSWIRILRGFEGYFDLPESQLRRALISAMVLGLQQEIRRPPIDVAGETPAEYAQRRGGLPVRRHSPLLSYNVNSLSAENVIRNKDGKLIVVDRDGIAIKDRNNKVIPAVPACELRRLALWAIKSKEMLEVVERDYMRPVFSSERYKSRRCPDATANGRNLMRISGSIERVPLGPTREYKFGHTVGGRRGYWIPQDLLP